MKARLSLMAVAITLTLTGGACAVELESDEQLAAYGLGHSFATNLLTQTQGLDLDLDALLEGVRAGFEGEESAVSRSRLNAAIENLSEIQTANQRQMQLEQAERARAEGEKFLGENAEREDIVVTDSGLQYEVLVATEDGRSPTAQDRVRVHYHGTRIDGEVFDSSVDRGEPAEFALSGVIAGWTEGVQLMSEGDRFRFFVPANLAYGDRSPSPAIPPGSVLVFDVELLQVLD